MATNNGNPLTRAYRELDRVLRKPKPAILGWQKSATEVVIPAPGGLGRVYITWQDVRDTAVNTRGVPLAPLLPILVVPGEPNEIVGIDFTHPDAVTVALNNEFGVPPHPHAFFGLTDTPDSYAGAAGQIVKVKATEDGLEFAAGGGGAVDSVNGQTGDVVLDADDIDDSLTTHKFASAAELSKLAGIEAGAEVNVNADWNAVTGDAQILNKPTIPTQYTDEMAQDAVGSALTGSSTVGFTYDDGANTITAIVPNDSITNAKIANMAQATVKGRAAAAGTGDPTDLSASQVLSILNLNALYVALTGSLAQTITGVKSFVDNMIIGTGTVAGVANLYLTQIGASLMRINSDTSGNPEVRFMMDGSSKVSMGVERSDDSFRLTNATSIAATSGLNLLSNRLGMGILPEGKAHFYDGTASCLFVSKTNITGTAQVIMPDGTGDVINGLIAFGTVTNSSGVGAFPLAPLIIATPGGTVIVVTPDGGTNAYTLRVNANGSVDIRRTTGTLAGTIQVLLVWS